MTDDSRLPDPSEVIERLPAGSAVIARSQEPEKVQALVHSLRAVCAFSRVRLLAATDPQSARLLHVDGIHLSEASVRCAVGAAVQFPRNWIVTAAAHSAPAVRRAQRLGADLIFISPVFPTRSHPDTRTLGPIGYRRLAQLVPEQACPLGGVTPVTLRQLKSAPVAAVVGIDLFLS